MSKGLKEALTALIATHVTHVKRVESCVCGFYATLYRVMLLILLHVERVKSVFCIKWPIAPPKYVIRAHNIFTDKFLNIEPIFNPNKVLESWDLGVLRIRQQLNLLQIGGTLELTMHFKHEMIGIW